MSLLNAVALPPLIAFIVSGVLVALLLRGGIASLALDLPNSRSLHATPTPRLGGVGIVGGIAAGWAYAALPIDPWLAGALILLAGVSLLDDVKHVHVAWRLVIHLAGAALAVFAILNGHEWWTIALVSIATAWMINLYNFMDGADGLAGGMAAFGFGGYGIAALAGGDLAFAAVSLSVSAAACGFLLFNFPPAGVFMGDGGSIPLGCLAAILHIAGYLRGDWPWWFGIVVFSPFIVDASLTLARRLLRGAKVWQAHREHYYQRLIRSGWGHRKTTLAEYALMVVCNAAAITAMHTAPEMQTAALVVTAAFYAVLAITLEKYFARHAQI